MLRGAYVIGGRALYLGIRVLSVRSLSNCCGQYGAMCTGCKHSFLLLHMSVSLMSR